MPAIASAATAVVIGYLASGHVDDPGRRRRDHAAEPLAAGDRRAVRDAGVAVSRPHRSRARPGSRHRPAHGPRAAPRPAERRPLPARRAGPAVALRPRAGRRADPGGARRGPRGAALDPRLEHVRRAAGGPARPSVRVRLALRAHRPDGRARALPARLPAVGAARGAVRDGRAERVRGRHGRRGAAPLHDAAAVVGEPLPRPLRPLPAADRRHRGVLVAGREGPGVGDALVLGRRARSRPCARAWSSSARAPASTS